MSVQPVRNERLNNFDFLRFFFAALVIFSHSFALLHGNRDGRELDGTEPLFVWSGHQISWGALAVNAFFIISGYLITHSWMRSKGLGDYLKKRALRIYPGFIVAVLLGTFVVAHLGATSDLVMNWKRWIVGLFTLKNVNPTGAFGANPLPNEINGSLWSISYEFWCYIGVAALGLTAVLKRRGVMLAIFLGAIALSVAFLVFKLNPGGKWLAKIFGVPAFWARLLPYYLAGTIFYLWRDKIPMSWKLAVASLVLCVAGVMLAPWGVALTFPIAFTYLLLYAAFIPVPKLPGWSKYGDFSYGLYLYAFPIQQLLVQAKPGLGPWTLFALATPLTLLFAVASWYLIEKPMMKLKSSKPKPKPAPVLEPSLEVFGNAGELRVAVERATGTVVAPSPVAVPSHSNQG